MSLEIQILLTLGLLLFVIGLFVVVSVSNFIQMILGIELMLNAANVNFLAFNSLRPQNVDGQIFMILVLVIAVCEASVGIALIYNFYKKNKKVIDIQV
ncbi:MAG: NADH-quinone oxidoreductase subunit NuoK [Cytophagales bacterium]